MSTYQELKGLKVKYLSSDTSGDRIKEGEVFYNSTDFKLKSFVATAAWNSSGSLLTGRSRMAGCGSPTAGLGFGGYAPTTGTTEEYNGSGWSISTNLNTARYNLGGCGTQTAGLGFAGYDASNVRNESEEYDGSSWTEGNNINTSRQMLAASGTQTAALGFGGYVPSPAANKNETEEYNGTSWSEQNNLNTARRILAGAGTQTAGLAFGGFTTTNSASTEEYDGTSWTASNNMGTARYGLGGAGTQTSALAFGGNSNRTEQYNGTSWTETGDLATSRGYIAGFGPSNTSAVAFGGNPNKSETEEFTVSITATTGAAFASGGNINNARRNAGCMGTQTAGLYAGGFGPPYLGYSEEYNGTSWTEGNDLTKIRECSTSGFGTQTAGAVAGGGAPDNITSPYSGYSNSTDEYNGTSWSEGGNMNSHRLGMATCGTQTAGFGAGGYQGANHPESPPSNTTKCEQYDGTSWTEVADLNTARSSMGHFGTQTASIACRGSSNPTESWDGSSWTNLPASPIVFNGGNHGGGTQTAGITYGPRSGNYTELWDGTTWISGVKYSTSRGGNCAGDASDGLLCGGFTGSGNSNATEEFTGETTATRAVKTIDFDQRIGIIYIYMAKKFKAFEERPKPKKRPRVHKKSKNKQEKRSFKKYNRQGR